MTRPLTPAVLRLVRRFGDDPGAIAEHLTAENRFHATGHGYSNPTLAAQQMCAAYRAASPADLARCQASIDKLNRELGI